MKKGIEVWPDYDESGNWCLKIEKQKGKLTLDEIIETAKEYEFDFYLLVVDAFHEDEEQCGDVPERRFAVLYKAELLEKVGKQ